METTLQKSQTFAGGVGGGGGGGGGVITIAGATTMYHDHWKSNK